jgi:hypothetical protein
LANTASHTALVGALIGGGVGGMLASAQSTTLIRPLFELSIRPILSTDPSKDAERAKSSALQQLQQFIRYTEFSRSEGDVYTDGRARRRRHRFVKSALHLKLDFANLLGTVPGTHGMHVGSSAIYV